MLSCLCGKVCRLLVVTAWLCSALVVSGQLNNPGSTKSASPSRVIIVRDDEATEAFTPHSERVRQMVQRGVTRLTGKATLASAWRTLVSSNDVVGIKVFTAPGRDAGTRVAVVAAVVEGLIAAKLPATNIIIWDRQRADLRRAGYMELAGRYGVRVEGSANAGYDEQTAYTPERPVPGQLVWGDLEFGRKGDPSSVAARPPQWQGAAGTGGLPGTATAEGGLRRVDEVGRRSFVSKLVAKGMTRIINVTPLLNHNTAGVSGHLYSLALGSVDNSIRFENDLFHLSTAVPEIYALPSLSDRVVLNITDALVCQYQGEQSSLLHYSTALNELRFSKDPVALDYLSLRELERTRLVSKVPIPREHSLTNQIELLNNAALLELGFSDEANIRIERVVLK